MLKRQWIISAVATIILLLLGAVLFQVFKAQKKSTVSEGPPKQEINYVQAAQFPMQSVSSKIPIDGRLIAYEKIEVAAEVTGRLEPIKRIWRKGNYFKKGDLLFKINNDDELLSLYANRSNLLNAITQIMPDLKFDYPQAYESWKTYLDGFQIEETTPVLPEVNNNQEKYYIAGKNIYNLFYSIKSAEDRLKNYQVFAPFSGVFLQVNAYPGTIVSPGSSLARIMNTSRFEMEAPIPSKEIKLVQTGQEVLLYAKDINEEYIGKISRIGRQIDQLTQSIPVFISVSGKNLRDGMFLKGELTGDKLHEVYVLPLESIVNQNQIYFVKDSTIVQQEIDIILRTDREVIVKGIAPDQYVITKGLNSLSPGQRAATL